MTKTALIKAFAAAMLLLVTDKTLESPIRYMMKKYDWSEEQWYEYYSVYMVWLQTPAKTTLQMMTKRVHHESLGVSYYTYALRVDNGKLSSSYFIITSSEAAWRMCFENDWEMISGTAIVTSKAEEAEAVVT